MHKFSFIVFSLGALYSLFIILFSFYKIFAIYYGLNAGLFFYFIYLTIGIFFFIVCILVLKTKIETRINLSLFFISVFTISLFFEVALEFSLINLYKNNLSEKEQLNNERKIIAKQLNRSYDNRNKLDVISDSKNNNIHIIPNPYPTYFSFSNGGNINGEQLFPVNGISNITTIFNNENGFYPIIQTDEYGFNNPKGLYNKKQTDIVILGDSFGEGYSVNNEENIAGILRKEGLKVLNLSRAGNGPLIQLATLKEYTEYLEPKVVLWFYNASDIVDLTDELHSEILKNYLYKKNFSQKLISKQKQIDTLFKKKLVDFHIALEQKMIENDPYVYSPNQKHSSKFFIRASNIIQFSNTRSLFKINPKLKITNEDKKLDIMVKILLKANSETLNWGGKLYIVYLPIYEIYEQKHLRETVFESFQTLQNNNQLLEKIEKIDIPIINIHKDGFNKSSDPKSFFPWNLSGHYNSKGYSLAAQIIKEKISNDL